MTNQPAGSSMTFAHHKIPSSGTPTVAHITRKPVSQEYAQSNHAAVRSTPEPSRAHVMGPRAMHPRLHSVDSPGLGLSSGKENIAPRRWSEQPPPMMDFSSSRPSEASPKPAYASQCSIPQNDDVWKPSSRDPNIVTNRRPNLPNRQSTETKNEPLSLTLIRRYDGSQWNVGKISNVCRTEGLWEKEPPSRWDDVSIHICTAGYAKFRDPVNSKVSGNHDQVFERRLLSLRRRSGDQSSRGDTSHVPKSRMSIDFRRLSKPRLEKTSGIAASPEVSKESQSSRPKGYGFYSPWDGICEFSSGISGHALKCKYTAPSEGSQAMTVSELRFNLPNSSRNIRTPSRPSITETRSYFSRGLRDSTSNDHHHSPEPDGDDGMNTPYGLSLGQEHAGGGFGGKQAKLGKLIIEAQGLKMLDLLVAANMGLWWKVYEKSA
ncbi:MAG: hypothetical protein Q9170_000982 [Blastenia crenularia]